MEEQPLLLYPRLGKTRAEELAAELGGLDVEAARGRSALHHADATYAPSGGHRVTEDHLTEIANGVRSIAARSGYPDHLTVGTEGGYRRFDTDAALFLHSCMGISAAEASVPDVWAFIGCILLPDIARWRFQGRGGVTTPERFLGAARGTRNVLGRLWWRSEILGRANDDGTGLLGFLSEDEIVAVMERPSLAGNRMLARHVCKRFRQVVETHPDVRRTDIMRDATKRVRRLLSLISFEPLDENLVGEIVDDVFRSTVAALQRI